MSEASSSAEDGAASVVAGAKGEREGASGKDSRIRLSKSMALKNLRQSSVSGEKIQADLSEAKGRARKLQARIADQPDGQKGRRIEMIGKVRMLLTKTPADERGLVPETPFTQAGVDRMMQILEKRSADGGGKVVEGIKKFLSPTEDGEEVISGASVRKLQLLASRTENLKERVKKQKKKQ